MARSASLSCWTRSSFWPWICRVKKVRWFWHQNVAQTQHEISPERKNVSKWIHFFTEQHKRKSLKKFTPILRLFASKLCKQPFVKPFNTPPPSLGDQVDVDQLRAQLLSNESTHNWRQLDDTEIHVESYEYLAFQKLPLFGAHFYYAYSPHGPIHTWQNVDKIVDRKDLKMFRDIEEMGEELQKSLTTSKSAKLTKSGSSSKKPRRRVQ